MADTFTITLRAEVNGPLSGSAIVSPVALTSTTGKFQKLLTKFQSGDNTVTPPTGANFCLIKFNPANSSTYKLKGIGGDTGATLGAVLNKFLFFPATAAFIINSTGTDSQESEIYWF